MPPEVHGRLWQLLADDPEAELTIDLAEEGILLPDGSTVDFHIDPFAKRMLLAGTDELGYLLVEGAGARGVGGGPPASHRYAGRGSLTPDDGTA